MSSRKDKFTFDGNLYETNEDGSLVKVLATDNVKSEGILETEVSEDGKSLTVKSSGLTINDQGLLCATFYEEEEV